MRVFYLFYKCWLELDEMCRNEFLGNIFNVANVSVSNVVLCEDRVIFKLFASNVFYNYSFFLREGNNLYNVDDRVIICHVFLGNGNIIDNQYTFIYQLLRCLNEFDVYHLVQKYLQ